MFTLPFVGRTREFRELCDACATASTGRGALVLLSGDGGVGKSRLVKEVADQLQHTGWQIAVGRSFPLETAIPYAAFADALGPVLASLDPGAMMRVTRGDRSLLAALAPHLAAQSNERTAPTFDAVTPAEQRVRLHTAILHVLARLGDRVPLLLCLENLQWADSASVELLHFLGRQIGTHKLVIVASWNETDQPLSADLRLAIRSLRSLGAQDVHLAPLTAAEVTSLLAAHFAVASEVVSSFAARLHHATQGNVFFVEQVLRELVTRGDLRRQGDVWIGWHTESLVLPPSVRDVLATRLARLSSDARLVAELLSIAGSSTSHALLRTVATDSMGVADHALHAALQELRESSLITEDAAGADVVYGFTHPLLQQALAQSVGLARERELHGALALSMEQLAGDDAEVHAEAIAAHWLRADPRVHPQRAVRWLLTAGRVALGRLARREAATSLRAALDRADAQRDLLPPQQMATLVDELARVYRRLAEYHEAIAMSERAGAMARDAGHVIGMAVAERRIGLSLLGLGRREEALSHFDRAIALAREAHDDTLLVRVQLAKSDCLQALGMVQDAQVMMDEALTVAEHLDSLPLLARAHRMLLMLHLWTGPAHRAWAHARRAVELAERTGERNVAWSAHFAVAVLGGLTSNTTALATHLAEATRLAQELASPLLELRTMEVALEYRAGIGEWDRALSDGERALTLARALEQTTLLARIAHWVSGVYLQRGDFAAAQRLVQEAWDVSGAAQLDLSRPFEVHGVLPAFVARTRYLHVVGEHAAAIELGQTALRIADRTSFIAWTVYRLLPTLASAAMQLGDMALLRDLRDRLAVESAKLAHPIGQAWVRVIDGMVAAGAGDHSRAVQELQLAIAALESVPYPYDAAETRVRLATVLLATGAKRDAVHEAQAAHSLFESLGAEPAVDHVRTMLRELGARLPAAIESNTLSILTPRELEIVKLVAQRLSNKEIGAKLGITARTAGTHLANIYDKLDVRDRTALGDLAREQGLHR